MAFSFKQAIEFNKFTMSLAAAGLAYAATVGSPAESSATAVPALVKWVATANLVAFSVSILSGVFVLGRASKLTAGDNDRVNDVTMKNWGVAHSVALCIGLVLAAFLMLNKVWRWV